MASKTTVGWVVQQNPPTPHPFSHWASNGELIFLSALGGHHADGAIDESVTEQVQVAFDTITHLLEECGATLEDIVHFRPIVSDRSYISELDECLNRHLPLVRPAGGALLIAGLADPRMKIEFEVIAVRGARIQQVNS